MVVHFPRGGGVLPEKLSVGVWPASQTPYPIYDQNLRFSLPYLWPKSAIFPTLFMTLNGGEEGKARLGEGRRDEKVAYSKKRNWRLECKKRYPIYDPNGGKMAKIDTQFMTKTAEKPYPLGPHIAI